MEEMRDYYPRFSDAEYQRRYRLVREAMAQRGLDCLVIYGAYRDYNQKNVVYFNPCTPDFKKGIFLGNLHLITERGAECLQKYPLEFVTV